MRGLVPTRPELARTLEAIEAGDRRSLLDLFAPDAVLTDDGRKIPVERWMDKELFGADGRLEVTGERADGWTLVGRFTSARWRLDTAWAFKIAGHRIVRLDVTAL